MGRDSVKNWLVAERIAGIENDSPQCLTVRGSPSFLSRRDDRFLLGDLVDEFLTGVEVLVHQARRGVGQSLSG